jgi:hypothetical protein
MPPHVTEELEALPQMTTPELCARYADLFGQPVRTRHKAYLVRKIAWRIQALAEGDLSQRARARAAELANDADVRLMPPKPKQPPPPAPPVGGRRVVRMPAQADPRLPWAGTAIVRAYKGKSIRVVVREDGLEYEGNRYKTLTAVAEAITGQHLNGYRFFRLEAK